MKVEMREGKHCIVEGDKIMGKYDTHEAAAAAMAKMKESMSYAFEPFGTLQGVLNGAPFKIFPEGTWYRDDRVLEITSDRLKEMAANMKSGMPRFKVPINENHGGIGKVGTVHDAEYRADGEDGAGLYATKYELTDAGKKLVAEKRFDAVSGEVMWTLNGDSKYQDPQTGEYKDNVLVGVALTDTPFFGTEVNLYSAKPNTKSDPFEPLKAWLTEKFKPQDTIVSKGTDMTDKKEDVVEAKVIVETFDAKAEIDKLNAQLKSKQDEFDAKLAAEKTRADEFAVQLAGERKVRELAEYRNEAQLFSTNLPVAVDEYAEKMHALNTKDPAIAKWVRDQFAKHDSMLAQSALFTQVGRTNVTAAGTDNIEALTQKIIAEEFDGDKSKYADAFILAGQRSPSLVPAEMRTRKLRQ